MALPAARQPSCRHCREPIPLGKALCQCDRAKAEFERITTFGPAIPT